MTEPTNFVLSSSDNYNRDVLGRYGRGQPENPEDADSPGCSRLPVSSVLAGRVPPRCSQ